MKTTTQRQMYRLFHMIDRVEPHETYDKCRLLLAKLGEKVGTKHPDLVRSLWLMDWMDAELAPD